LLQDADPGTTLFIVSSKTFTRSRPVTNARTARAVAAGKLGEPAVPRHFAGRVGQNTRADGIRRASEYASDVRGLGRGPLLGVVLIGVSLAIASGERNFSSSSPAG